MTEFYEAVKHLHPPPVFTEEEKYYIENILTWGNEIKLERTGEIIERNYVKVVAYNNYIKEYYDEKGNRVDIIFSKLID